MMTKVHAPEGIRVHFDDVATHWCHCVGRTRATLRSGDRKHFFLRDELLWWSHEKGCRGELAGAFGLEVPWTEELEWTPGKLRPDIGSIGQVRAITDPIGCLSVEPDDLPGHKFILADLSEFPTALLVGWVFGYEAQERPELQALNRERRPYLVPNTMLHSIYDVWPL